MEKKDNKSGLDLNHSTIGKITGGDLENKMNDFFGLDSDVSTGSNDNEPFQSPLENTAVDDKTRAFLPVDLTGEDIVEKLTDIENSQVDDSVVFPEPEDSTDVTYDVPAGDMISEKKEPEKVNSDKNTILAEKVPLKKTQKSFSQLTKTKDTSQFQNKKSPLKKKEAPIVSTEIRTYTPKELQKISFKKIAAIINKSNEMLSKYSKIVKHLDDERTAFQNKNTEYIGEITSLQKTKDALILSGTYTDDLLKKVKEDSINLEQQLSDVEKKNTELQKETDNTRRYNILKNKDLKNSIKEVKYKKNLLAEIKSIPEKMATLKQEKISYDNNYLKIITSLNRKKSNLKKKEERDDIDKKIKEKTMDKSHFDEYYSKKLKTLKYIQAEKYSETVNYELNVCKNASKYKKPIDPDVHPFNKDDIANKCILNMYFGENDYAIVEKYLADLRILRKRVKKYEQLNEILTNHKKRKKIIDRLKKDENTETTVKRCEKSLFNIKKRICFLIGTQLYKTDYGSTAYIGTMGGFRRFSLSKLNIDLNGDIDKEMQKIVPLVEKTEIDEKRILNKLDSEIVNVGFLREKLYKYYDGLYDYKTAVSDFLLNITADSELGHIKKFNKFITNYITSTLDKYPLVKDQCRNSQIPTLNVDKFVDLYHDLVKPIMENPYFSEDNLDLKSAIGKMKILTHQEEDALGQNFRPLSRKTDTVLPTEEISSIVRGTNEFLPGDAIDHFSYDIKNNIGDLEKQIEHVFTNILYPALNKEHVLEIVRYHIDRRLKEEESLFYRMRHANLQKIVK